MNRSFKLRNAVFHIAIIAAVVSAGINLIAVLFGPTFQFPLQLRLSSNESATLLAGIGGNVLGAFIAGLISWRFERKKARAIERGNAAKLLMSAVDIANEAAAILHAFEEYRINSAAALPRGQTPLTLVPPIALPPAIATDHQAASIFIEISKSELAARFANMHQQSRAARSAFAELLNLRNTLESLITLAGPIQNGVASVRTEANESALVFTIASKLNYHAPEIIREYTSLRSEAQEVAAQISKTFRNRYGWRDFPTIEFPKTASS